MGAVTSRVAASTLRTSFPSNSAMNKCPDASNAIPKGPAKFEMGTPATVTMLGASGPGSVVQSSGTAHSSVVSGCTAGAIGVDEHPERTHIVIAVSTQRVIVVLLIRIS